MDVRQYSSRLLLSVALCLIAGVTFANPQAGKSVRATLGSGVVKLGDVGEIIVEANDAQNVRVLDVPEVEGIQFSNPSGPSLHQSQSFRNGRVVRSRRLTYVIRFRPNVAGEYTLGPIRLNVDGKEVTTQSMKLTVVTDLDGERFGMLEFIDLPERVYDGEVFTIELRFGWDNQLSRINSADLRLPWWGNLSGVLEVPSDEPALGGKPTRVSLNSGEHVEVIEVPQVQVDGKPYRTFVLKRQFVATRSGTLEIPKSFLVYSVVESGGIFNTQQQTRERYFVGAESQSIEVLPLPTEGRPLEYSNAVGQFNVRALTDRWDVDVGDSIKLTVEWLGKGNLEFFERPDLSRLDSFKGFRSYGVSRDSFLGDRRIVIYDIAPLRPDIAEIPGVPLSVFDTATGAYTTITSDPIPIRVRALEGATPLGDAGEAGREFDITDIQTSSGDPTAESTVGTGKVLLFMLLCPLVALGVRVGVRRHGDPDAADQIRKRKARKNLARSLRGSESASAQARALYDFLAARSAEGPGAWIGRDARADGRLDQESAQALNLMIARLDESTYAQSDAAIPQDEILSLADRVAKGGL